MTSGAQTNADGQWHDRFTAPKSSAPCFSQTELLHVLQDKNKISGRDFLPIDVRRNDHEVVSPLLKQTKAGADSRMLQEWNNPGLDEFTGAVFVV